MRVYKRWKLTPKDDAGLFCGNDARAVLNEDKNVTIRDVEHDKISRFTTFHS